MTISRHLLILVTAQLALLLALAGFSWQQLSVIRDRSQLFTGNITPSLAIISHLGHTHLQVRRVLGALEADDSEDARSVALGQFARIRHEHDRLLARYRAEFVLPDERPILDRFEQSSAAAMRGVQAALSSAPLGSFARHAGAGIDGEGGLMTETVAALDEWIGWNERLATVTAAEANQAIGSARRNLLAAGLVLAVVSAWLGTVIRQRTLRPLQVLSSTVQQLSTGAFQGRVPFVERSDETGILARSVEQLREAAAETETQRWLKHHVSACVTSVQFTDTDEDFAARLLDGLVPSVYQAGCLHLVPVSGQGHRCAGLRVPAGTDTSALSGTVGALVDEIVRTRGTVVRPLRQGSGQLFGGPLLVRERLIGVLVVARLVGPLEPRELALAGELLAPLGSSLDNLQRRSEVEQQRQLLRDTEAWFRQVIERAPEGILVADDHGQVVFANIHAAGLFGVLAGGLVGRPVESLLPVPRRGEPATPYRSPEFGRTISLSGLAMRHGGEVFHAEAELSRLQPVPGREGTVCVTIRDVTARKRVELAMAKLSRAVEQASSMIVITDLDGRIEYVNPQFSRTYGYSVEEAIGQNPRILRSGRTPSAVYTELWRTIVAGEVWRGELVNRAKDGTLIEESIVISPIKDDSGTTTHYVAIKEDITVQRSIQREVELYKFAVERAGPMIWVEPSSGRAIYANQAALDELGYTSDEMLGLHIWDWAPEVTLEQLGRFEAGVRAADQRVAAESFHRRKDGSRAEVSVTISIVDTPGRSVLVGAFTDITERKRSLAALQAERARLHELLDSSPIAVAFTVDGIVRFANPRFTRQFGLSVGEPVAPIYRDPDERPRIVEQLRRSGIARDVQVGFRGPDGQPLDIMATFLTMTIDGEEAVVGWLVDIAPLKEAQREMQRARDAAEAAAEAKASFLANMSHEIRTPMNAIMGMTHLALQAEMPARARGYLEKVNTSAEHLLALINDILDFSKIDAGRLAIEQVPFRLDEVLDSVADLIGPKAEEKGLEFVFAVPPDLPAEFVGDPLRLKQILLNLASNAVKFTEQGSVTVGVLGERRGDGWMLSLWVRDTGIGLTAEQKGRLFQSFSQADISTTRRYGGTGLGLAISKRLVDLMHGRIWVESQTGEGATFHFEVLLGARSEAPAPRAATREEFAGIRILVADDNPAALDVVRPLLERMGMQVDTADDSDAALARLRAARDAGEAYPVALIDWRMPPQDGAECIARYQQDGPAPTRFVLFTAHGRYDAFEAAARKGARVTTVLPKPATPSHLYSAVSQALRGSASASPFPAAAPTPPSGSGAATRLAGLVVLVVEDNEMNIELAVELLRSAGATTAVARDGREAVDCVRSGRRFDVVLMDCHMPEMDGYDATRAIRALPSGGGIPIIALTASVMEDDRQHALEVGMNDQVAKPVDVEVLYATIERWTRSAAPRPATPTAPPPAAPADAPSSTTPSACATAAAAPACSPAPACGSPRRSATSRRLSVPRRPSAARTPSGSRTP
jgi:PAS domain S-box-containing protein